MSPVSAIALSGMNAAMTRLRSGAHNIANAQTEPFRREEVQASARAAGGVDVEVGRAVLPGHALATDLVGQLEAKNAFLANLAVFRTGQQMTGTLIDTIG